MIELDSTDIIDTSKCGCVRGKGCELHPTNNKRIKFIFTGPKLERIKPDWSLYEGGLL